MMTYRGEEWEAVEEIIAEENEVPNVDEFDDECLQVAWSSSGLCPCCGDLLELHDALYPVSDGGVYQLCNSCGWESEIGYDL